MVIGQMIPILNIFKTVMLPMFVTPWVAVGNLAGTPFPQMASMIPSMIVVPIVEIVLLVVISVWVFRKVEL
jgi:hypothetical protein